VADLTGKHVELRRKVDPGVLGGLRLEYEGKSLDGTVRQRLDGLKKALSDTVL
jgi:F-type H+-transporting ATPase subunit delta